MNITFHTISLLRLMRKIAAYRDLFDRNPIVTISGDVINHENKTVNISNDKMPVRLMVNDVWDIYTVSQHHINTVVLS